MAAAALPSSMRAIVIHKYGDVNVLVEEQIPLPTLLPRDVLVRIHAISTNPVDVKVRTNVLNAPEVCDHICCSRQESFQSAFFFCYFLCISSWCFVSRATAVQQKDSGLGCCGRSCSAGLRSKNVEYRRRSILLGCIVVFSTFIFRAHTLSLSVVCFTLYCYSLIRIGSIVRDGCYAEYCAVDERIVGKKPKNLSFEEAAAEALTALTAYEVVLFPSYYPPLFCAFCSLSLSPICLSRFAFEHSHTPFLNSTFLFSSFYFYLSNPSSSLNHVFFRMSNIALFASFVILFCYVNTVIVCVVSGV
jgi:hypothetical protein